MKVLFIKITDYVAGKTDRLGNTKILACSWAGKNKERETQYIFITMHHITLL